MPVVRSYYRRSPGMAAGDGASAPPDLDVAIYGYDGALLRDGSAGRYRAEQVRFTTGLPGGFLQASFTLGGGTGRTWAGRAGHQVIIRQGRRMLWWGWIEDIRRQGAAGDVVGVNCFGPWQVASQRLLAPSFVPSTTANTAIGEMMDLYMPEMSLDRSGLASTGVALAAMTWTYTEAAQLIKRVCDTGNTSSQQMLFAFWEPGAGGLTLQRNGSFETWVTGADDLSGWTFATVSGTPTIARQTTSFVHDGVYSVWCLGTGAGSHKGQVYQEDIVVTPSTGYSFDYWVYWQGGVIYSLTCQIKVSWYTGTYRLIQTDSATLHNDPGSRRLGEFDGYGDEPGRGGDR